MDGIGTDGGWRSGKARSSGRHLPLPAAMSNPFLAKDERSALTCSFGFSVTDGKNEGNVAESGNALVVIVLFRAQMLKALASRRRGHPALRLPAAATCHGGRGSEIYHDSDLRE